MAYTQGLGPCAARRAGSSPALPTENKLKTKYQNQNMSIEKSWDGTERREDFGLREAIDDLKKQGIDTKKIETMIEYGYVNMSDGEIETMERSRKDLAAAYNMSEDTHWDVLMEKVKEILDREKKTDEVIN